MRRSSFNFYSVNQLYYKCDKINFKRGSSYVDSPDWISNKKATINPKNNDYRCFQYAATITLNHEKVNSYPKRASNIRPYINNYN